MYRWGATRCTRGHVLSYIMVLSQHSPFQTGLVLKPQRKLRRKVSWSGGVLAGAAPATGRGGLLLLGPARRPRLAWVSFVEALDSALTAFHVLLWLPGCLVVVFPLDLVRQSAILGFVVYVNDLLKLPFVFDVAVIVPFGDSARDLAAFPG